MLAHASTSGPTFSETERGFSSKGEQLIEGLDHGGAASGPFSPLFVSVGSSYNLRAFAKLKLEEKVPSGSFRVEKLKFET